MSTSRDAALGSEFPPLIESPAMPRYIVTGETMPSGSWSMPVEAETPEEAVNVAARTTLRTSTYQVWAWDADHDRDEPLYETVRSGKPIREIHFVRGPWKEGDHPWAAIFKYVDTGEEFIMHFADELHATDTIEKYQRWEGRWPLGR